MQKNGSTVNTGALVLLEPDDDVRDAMQALLAAQGWQVESTLEAQALAKLLQGKNIAAVISEASLPGCQASEILRLCTAQNIPLIFTGHDLPAQAAVDLIRQGADDYLEKPFSRTRLLDLLNQFTGRQTK